MRTLVVLVGLLSLAGTTPAYDSLAPSPPPGVSPSFALDSVEPPRSIAGAPGREAPPDVAPPGIAPQPTPNGRVIVRPPVVVDGELDARVLRRVLMQRRRAFLRCYERSLARNPQAAGMLRVVLTIAQGRVAGLELEQRNIDDATGSCAIGLLRRLRMPARDEPARARVVLIFRRR